MTQRETVLKMLQEAGISGVTNGDFLREYIPRFSGRIKELRKEGYVIVTERETASSFRYRLAGVERGGAPSALSGEACVPSVVARVPSAPPASLNTSSLFEVGQPQHSHWDQGVA